MNHNWEYKKFSQLVNTIIPITKIDKSSYLKTGSLPIVSQEESQISGYWNNPQDITPHSKAVVIFGDHSRVLKYIDFDFVVGADGVKILEPKDGYNPKFLFHYLRWYNVPSLGYSRHFKLIKEARYPVPPMDVQQQVVAELDKLNEMIATRKEQLKELDNLAQSLFYTTFGDPITNPIGWPLKKLGEVCVVSSAKRVLVEDVVSEGIPFIRGTELAILSRQNTYDESMFSMYITPEHYEKVKAITGVPEVGDLLIPSINADGYVWDVNTPKPLYFKDGRVLWVHVNKNIFTSKWLKYTLSKIIQVKYANLSRGAVFAELTLVFLRNLSLPLPPLALQQQFASQVEAIERQKEVVQSSISELQTLLDSRMDYWFN